MDLKNKVFEIIQKIGSSKISYLLIIISLLIILFNNICHPLTKNESVIIHSTTKFDFSNDRNYLTCIYDQLVCYGDHAGENKVDILNSCKEVGVCDSLSR